MRRYYFLFVTILGLGVGSFALGQFRAPGLLFFGIGNRFSDQIPPNREIKNNASPVSSSQNQNISKKNFQKRLEELTDDYLRGLKKQEDARQKWEDVTKKEVGGIMTKKLLNILVLWPII